MFEFITILVLVILGYIFGRLAEKRHYDSILEREKNTLQTQMVTLKTIPNTINVKNSFLVTANVVISIDYFKRILAALKNIFGGRITSYESLLDRARREAILRIKELAIRHHASAIYNVRLETASISRSARKSVGSVEVLAYGTAIVTDEIHRKAAS